MGANQSMSRDRADRPSSNISAQATPPSIEWDQDRDGFWLCGTAIPRSLGICEHVLLSSGGIDINAPATETAATEPNELPVSVVPDLATDARFQNRPFIERAPFNRFYAGVPIRTPGPHGMNIGVYCIYDTKPRPQGLSSDEVDILRDISRTIMGYLECRVSHERFGRSERMVRGMGNFVEGLDSLVPAPKPGSGHSRKRSLKLSDSKEVAPGDRRRGKLVVRSKKPEAPFKSINASTRILDEALLSPRTPNPPYASKDAPSFNNGSPLLEPATAADIRAPRQLSLTAEDSSQCSTPRAESQHSGQSSPRQHVLSQVSTADLQRAEIGRVFARAANIIRQSIEIDGVLFLDATVRSFGGLVGQQSERKVSAVGMENLNYLSNDEDSTREGPPPASKDDSCCNVLGYATSQGCGIGNDNVPWPAEGLRDRTLQRLLRRYPHGRIFNFEANGEALHPPVCQDREPLTPNVPPRRPASPVRHWSHDSQDPDELQCGANAAPERKPTIQRQRWSAAESVIHLFPGARSVVLIPLWDGQKKRWAAGGFIWTNSPTRVFTADGTLRFLRVFGLIVMAEIYRLNTKAEETIKSNILGSISHELRSPLHGLVGAVELLHDSNLDAVQQNVLNIIETSGKTLVDTINHLLDYSKINSYIENDKKDSLLGKVGTEPKDRSVQEKAKSQTLPVELDCLVEEVVESVLAGFSHERMSSPRAVRDVTEYRMYGQSQTLPNDMVGTDRVQIYLDIEPSKSWRFRTHPGAFRRIVMNLFGNSLKFTKSGFIKISLGLETAKPYQQDAPAAVLLSVADSGKGISDDYLQNHLFTPFCQEDHFAPGTGLGLSLVRQITINLGGEVKVASQVGRGTTITVSLPLPSAGDEAPLAEVTGFKDMQVLKERKIVLRGFDGLPSPEARPMVLGTEEAGKLLESQAHVLQNTCRNWLQMQVLSEAEALTERPDFIVHHDSTLSFDDAERIAAQAPCPVLFVCEASVAARNFSCNLPDANSRIRTFDFFSPPLGPRKLAKGLCHLLGMWKVKQEQNEPMNHTTSVEVLPISAEESRALALANKTPIISAQGIELGQGVKLVKSLRATRAIANLAPTQTAGFQGSPLPTPPEDPRNKDPMARTEREASTAPADGDIIDSAPAVLIADDNAINLKVNLQNGAEDACERRVTDLSF